MSGNSIGPLTVRALGRGEPGGPAIMLCHGFGAPGDDLVGLARAIDAGPGVRWFFPEAPLEVDFGMGAVGRAWWPVDMERMVQERARGGGERLANETPDGLFAARDALEAMIAELERSHGVDRKRLILGGFSQGAILSTELSLFAETPFAGLIAMSGTVVARDRWEAAGKSSGPRISALVTHGEADPVLPFSGGEALRDLLRAAGADVTWIAHRGQHEIPKPALDAFATFARKRLAG